MGATLAIDGVGWTQRTIRRQFAGGTVHKRTLRKQYVARIPRRGTRHRMDVSTDRTAGLNRLGKTKHQSRTTQHHGSHHVPRAVMDHVTQSSHHLRHQHRALASLPYDARRQPDPLQHQTGVLGRHCARLHAHSRRGQPRTSADHQVLPTGHVPTSRCDGGADVFDEGPRHEIRSDVSGLQPVGEFPVAVVHQDHATWIRRTHGIHHRFHVAYTQGGTGVVPARALHQDHARFVPVAFHGFHHTIQVHEPVTGAQRDVFVLDAPIVQGA
eukprot:scaffold308_cov327-Pavlova_lutheri.AAC.35